MRFLSEKLLFFRVARSCGRNRHTQTKTHGQLNLTTQPSKKRIDRKYVLLINFSAAHDTKIHISFSVFNEFNKRETNAILVSGEYIFSLSSLQSHSSSPSFTIHLHPSWIPLPKTNNASNSWIPHYTEHSISEHCTSLHCNALHHSELNCTTQIFQKYILKKSYLSLFVMHNTHIFCSHLFQIYTLQMYLNIKITLVWYLKKIYIYIYI